MEHQQRPGPEGLDYAQRNRKLEWRSRWFHLTRSDNEGDLLRIRELGLKRKRSLIEKQLANTDHRAGYAPVGPGTPWFSIGPRNVNGRVKCLAVHPTNENLVYAGAASGGVWKSTDGGQSWHPLWDQQESLAIGALAIAPSSADTIYAGTGEGVLGIYGSGHNFPGAGLYVSTDAGVTWTRRAAVVNRRITRVLVSPTDAARVYVAGLNGIEGSADWGVTWTTLRAGEASDAVIDPTNGSILYVCLHNDGIYKSTNGGTTWALLSNGPTGPSANWVKIAIGVSGASGSNFLVAKSVGKVYTSTDGGNTWTTLAGNHGSGWTGWCDLVAVAPDDQNVCFAGGVWLERTTNGGTSWTTPAGLHADQHVAVFSPSNPNVVYECNDGGVYRSTDKGATWKKVSHGLVVTQFYDIGAWGSISTVLGGGTQDQGTNMTTGGLTWRSIHGGDGMYFVEHPTDPRTLYAEYQSTVIEKSIDGGNTWAGATAGLTGSNPWVGVITMSPANANTLYTGTTRVFRTTDGCATPWVASSQGFGVFVSAIAVAPSNANRVYAGTGDSYFRLGQGKVFRSDDGGATSPWAEKTGTLPSARPVTDLAVDADDANRVFVSYGGTNNTGTNANAVFLSTNGGDAWTDVSGDLPNVSVNALALDPNNDNTVYAGTDIGVFRTTNAGANWQAFDNGIPNVVISDLHIDPEDQMLYAATFGRGMYKLSIAPAATVPAVDLYLRDSILDTGERFPSPGGQPHPNDVSDVVDWWESPDMKVEVAPFYAADAVFDGVEFDEEVIHDDPNRTVVNRFYLQVHNRGWQPTANVRVRAFFADAHAGLPNLPNALTPPDFNLTSTSDWQPIGPAQTIALLEPNRPVIVSWDWTVPAGANTHSCLLAVVSSPDDPITTTDTNVNTLVNMEKRVGLKNLHVINSSGPRPAPTMVAIKFHNAKEVADLMDIVIRPVGFAEGTIGLLLEPVTFGDGQRTLDGVQLYYPRVGENLGTWYDRPGTRAPADRTNIWKTINPSVLYEFDPTKTAALRGIKIGAKQTIQAVITARGTHNVPYGRTQQFAVVQVQQGHAVGGSTYEIRLRRARALHPVSRIRIVLDRVRILDDHDPFLKGRGEFRFLACVTFNDDHYRRHWCGVPRQGLIKISDRPGCNEHELNACIFDGYVAEKDSMTLSIHPFEEDWGDADDELTAYRRHFNYPPETWVGDYGPEDESTELRAVKNSDWMVWFHIQSIKF